MNEIRKVSVVVPVFNEEGNVEPLVEEIAAVMNQQNPEWELWLVDDGSTDASLARIRTVCEREPHAGFLSFRRNRGQSAAFGAGFEAATGDVIVTLDADLQNDPADIPTLLDMYRQGFDMVIGWRVTRRDDSARRFASRVGNAVRNALTAEIVHDTGCSLKVMRTSMARRLPMFRGMHRFLPTLMKMGPKWRKCPSTIAPGTAAFPNTARSAEGGPPRRICWRSTGCCGAIARAR